MLVCRGRLGAALREPHAVLEDLDLTPDVRRVLIPLSARVHARSSYVVDQAFVFEDSGFAHQGEHAVVLESGCRGGEACHLRTQLGRYLDRSDRIFLEVLQRVGDLVPEARLGPSLGVRALLGEGLDRLGQVAIDIGDEELGAVQAFKQLLHRVIVSLRRWIAWLARFVGAVLGLLSGGLCVRRVCCARTLGRVVPCSRCLVGHFDLR